MSLPRVPPNPGTPSTHLRSRVLGRTFPSPGSWLKPPRWEVGVGQGMPGEKPQGFAGGLLLVCERVLPRAASKAFPPYGWERIRWAQWRQDSGLPRTGRSIY